MGLGIMRSLDECLLYFNLIIDLCTKALQENFIETFPYFILDYCFSAVYFVLFGVHLKAWGNWPTLLAKHYCFRLKSGVTFLSIANDLEQTIVFAK